jgi:predicted RND superfamily exporter protein
VDQFPYQETKVLVSQDGNKARISARIKDIGADHIKSISDSIQSWINTHTNPNIATFRQTGTGLIIDKNTEYVRKNLIEGLGLAIIIVGILMALLFKNWKMLMISLIPNVFPLLVAGALLGYLGIDLEAGVSIVFAVIFGIAVDDTIHFLSKYKLALHNYHNTEEALSVTFAETGKAICLTSIILFFGFLIMLFSIHPPSVTIGLLISITLLSALFSDLLLIPVMVRWLIPQKSHPTHQKI